MKLNVRPVIGADVGLSLMLTQLAAHHQPTPELFLCDLAVSHSIYGRDRLQDQINNDDEPIVTSKNVNFWNASTTLANLLVFFFLVQFHHVEGIPILSFVSNAYSKSKTKIGAAKPLFIGVLWAYAIVFLPPDSVPNDLFFVYSSLYSSVSNIADIKDIEEDKLNDIQTIPVLLGEKKTYALSSVLASIAIATHHTNMLTAAWTVGDTFIEVVSTLVFAYASFKSLG